MRQVSLMVAAGFLLPTAYAQTCPPVNFVQGNQVTLYDGSTGAGLVRQADGSFTRQRYNVQSPYKKIDSTADYQSVLLSCSAAGNRTFRTPPGWTFLADQQGVPSQPVWISNFLGNGTQVGLAAIPGGQTGGPATDSLLVVILNTDGSVGSKTYYAVAANPLGVLVGDFNRDGKKDVVVISGGSGTASDPGGVSVFLGNGDGTLQPGVKYSAHNSPVSAVAYDFNGDGKLDLAVANMVSGDVSILLGRGDGTFAAAVNYAAVAGASSIALGDFNADGKADLVVGGGQNLAMLAGNADGTFRAAVVLPLSITPTALAAGDFNKDGKLDLAVTDSYGGTVSILLGDGTGKFSAEYDYVAGYEPSGLFAMDLDGDGNLDVVLATGHPDLLAPNASNDTVVAFFGRGDGTLIGPPAYKVGSRLGALVLADFNGDGKPDVAVAAGDVWILLSSGGGNFRTPVRIPMPASNGSSATMGTLAAGDFNGDGKPDLVVGSAYGEGVYVLLGNGDGTFQAPVHYTVGGYVTSVAVADFNGDGKLDIAACGHLPGSLDDATAGVLLGNGNGTFQSVKTLTGFGNGPYWLAVGDFNKDGKPDLAIANQGTPGDPTDVGGVLVFLGLGNGSFQSPTNYPAGISPNFVTAADVNGDGAADLLVATRAPSYVYEVAVLLGVGNGTFGQANMFTTEYGPAWIAVADLNGDGKPDLAIAHCCGATDATFMLGNGDGTFQPDVHLTAAVAPSSLAVADLNGDGKPDLVIGLFAVDTSSVAAFLSFTPAQLTNVNGASFLSGPLAPDSFATAQGTGLATVTQSAAAPYPTGLGGTTVSVRDSSGAQQLGGLAYVSPTQVNYIVPHGTALGPATVTVTAGNGTATSGPVTIAAIDPGIFVFGGTNLAAAWVIRVHADNSETYENVYAVSSSGALVPAPIDVSPADGQVYLELYGTGLRGHSAAANSVIVTAGGASLTVLYAGQQGGASSTFPGLDQIDVLLPSSLAGKGDVAIQVTVDGQAANPCHVTIK